jgi:hypothetical protein
MDTNTIEFGIMGGGMEDKVGFTQSIVNEVCITTKRIVGCQGFKEKMKFKFCQNLKRCHRWEMKQILNNIIDQNLQVL